MLRYRTLLVDTESSYRRPVQAFFSDMEQVTDWCNKVLPQTKSKKSWVEIYENSEREVGRINRKDVPLKPRPDPKEAAEEPAP